VTTFFVGLAGLLVYLEWDLFRDRSLSPESKSWPTVPATILDSRLGGGSSSRGGHSSSPVIHYRYVVGGHEYVSHRVSWCPSYDDLSARVRVARWPAGSTTTAWYRPSDPSVAVLEPDSWDGDLLIGLMMPPTLLMVILALGFVVLLVKAFIAPAPSAFRVSLPRPRGRDDR